MDKTVEIIIQIIQILIVPAVLYAVRVGGAYLVERAKGERLQRLITLAQESMECAVSETAQVYVDELKRTGKWNAEGAETARKLAVGRAREIMGAKSYNLLQEAIGDAGAYFDALNEAYVRGDLRKPKKDQVPPVGAHQ